MNYIDYINENKLQQVGFDALMTGRRIDVPAPGKLFPGFVKDEKKQAVGAKIVLIKLHNIIHVAKSGKKGLLITHFVFITPFAQEGQGVHHFANQSSLHKAKSASFETRYCFTRLWFRDNVVLFLRN